MAVGACEHNQVCARCCLRLRICYDDNRCPLCKAPNSEIIVARPRADGTVQTFAELSAQRPQLWSNKSWAKGVLVAPGIDAVEESPAGQAQRTKKTLSLHVSLMQVTQVHRTREELDAVFLLIHLPLSLPTPTWPVCILLPLNQTVLLVASSDDLPLLSYLRRRRQKAVLV